MNNLYLASVLAAIIGSLIYYDLKKHKFHYFSHTLFKRIIEVFLILVVVDVCAIAFDKLEGSIFYWLNNSFNLLLFILLLVPTVLWFIYAHYQIFNNEKILRKIYKYFLVVIVLNTVLTIISFFGYNIFYYIDSNNIYHRGDYFWVHALFIYSILIITFLLIFINRKLVDVRTFKSMLIYPIPIIIASFLQIANYGILLIMPSMTISFLVIYFNIQEFGLNTDYLTGCLNRRSFDTYVKNKIKNSSSESSFSAIILDMDNFKQINDNLGHKIGDEALQETVKILRNSLEKTAIIARFGGDEFCILLDIDKKEQLKNTINIINKAKVDYNETSNKPYKLNFSMGYDVYDIKSKMDEDTFIRHIDSLMYKEKIANFRERYKNF